MLIKAFQCHLTDNLIITNYEDDRHAQHISIVILITFQHLKADRKDRPREFSVKWHPR